MLEDLREWWLGRQKMKFVLTIIALVLISLFMSCQELHYMVSGKTADATMNSRVENFENRMRRVVGYNYMDRGEARQKFVEVPMDWPGVGQPTVKVQYIPGSDTSRLYGQTNMVWVIIFFISLAVAAVAAVVVVKWG